MSENQSRNTTKILAVLLVLAMLVLARESVQYASALEGNVKNGGKKPITIVIDAGHGGSDPGKVGVNGALEKDINLAVALKLEKNLKQQGVNVVMTRTEDKGLYKEGDSNKKYTI